MGLGGAPFFLLCRKHPFLFRFMLNIQNNKYKVANKTKWYKSILYICIDLNNINFKTKNCDLCWKYWPWRIEKHSNWRYYKTHKSFSDTEIQNILQCKESSFDADCLGGLFVVGAYALSLFSRKSKRNNRNSAINRYSKNNCGYLFRPQVVINNINIEKALYTNLILTELFS